MALIFCPECGTQISEHAKLCHKCSYPIYNLKNNNKNQHSSYLTQTFNNKYNSQIGADSGLIISGYVMAFLSLIIFPFVFLLTGIVIGIITISKGSVGHGVVHIILSILFGLIGMILGVLTWFF